MPDRSMSKDEPYGITAYTNRGQGVFLVLFALNELGGSNSKQDVIQHISKGGWYQGHSPRSASI